MSIKDLLISAANELAKYIGEYNSALTSKITPVDSCPPDYADYQTCQELAELSESLFPKLEKIEGVPTESGEYICVDEIYKIEFYHYGQLVNIYDLNNNHFHDFEGMPGPWYKLPPLADMIKE